MHIAAALLASLLVLLPPSAVVARAEASPSPAPVAVTGTSASPQPTTAPGLSTAPDPSTASDPSTAPGPDTRPLPRRPILAPPLERPDGPRPRLKITRPADAVVEKRGVRLELWVSRKPVRVGRFLAATMRVTNLRGDTISHSGQTGCDSSNARLTVDISGLLDAGVTQAGRALRFKRQFLRASGMDSLGMSGMRRRKRGCLGSVGTYEPVAPGRSLTVPATFFVRYPWRDQPLPGGTTIVTAHYRFSPDAFLAGDGIDIEVSAPVRIRGVPVDYPSPQQLADAALEVPELRAWVDTRWKNAMYHLNVDVAYAVEDGRTLADRHDVGGVAPKDVISFDMQARGKTHSWFRNVAIDLWSATVEEVDLVAFDDD